MVSSDPFAGDLAAWGKVIVIETRGRSSGLIRRTNVGFIESGAQDPALLVAASDDETHWARNLLAHPDCHVIRAGERRPYHAQLLPPADGHAVVAELILKYGTPAERLGGGPAFRLLPREEVPAAAG